MTVLPSIVEQFLLRNIDSVAEMEALLLLRREADVSWDKESLAKRVYIAPEAADIILQSLLRRGFVIKTEEAGVPTYRYGPRSDDLASAVDSLADCYSKYLIPITNLLHSKPGSAVQHFADAFRFRDRK